MIRRVTGWCVAGAGVAVLALLAGSGMGMAAPPKHSVVIVLLDESSSFVNYWQPSVELAATVAGRLTPGDAFAVIGVDDQGGDPEDVRIPVTVINPGALMALGDKKNLAKKVRALTPRKSKRDLTDILNAIHQAALLSDSPALQGYRPELLFFSDMQESVLRDPKTRSPRLPVPADIKGWKFGTRGEAHCFFVNVTGWADRSKKTTGTTWDLLADSWVAVLNAAGLDADSKKSFHQSGDAKIEINRLFP